MQRQSIRQPSAPPTAYPQAPFMITAYIGIGSNLDNPLQQVNAATKALAALLSAPASNQTTSTGLSRWQLTYRLMHYCWHCRPLSNSTTGNANNAGLHAHSTLIYCFTVISVSTPRI